MTCVVEKDVFWLQIAIYDVEAMQVFQCTEQFCSIEPATVLVELAFALQVIEQLSTVDWRVFDTDSSAGNRHAPNDMTK